MAKKIENNPFKPRPTPSETKADSISRVAMGMVEQETVRRDAKTARLREARLAKEASDATAERAAPSPTRGKARG
ncbi:hypothetical protein [Ancylobacter amanitiformis]|uniref:Transcriptional regulator n=1 Tax=Ancylobacter amanitiformis TaxID=217069 RepID=A0ABU0LPX6_9HYPH|nr:hypothetical protein [Ancylobacter amanitiformis]MDQ0510705.1 hypothetical protein [Ancylobacter amanitiformis]